MATYRRGRKVASQSAKRLRCPRLAGPLPSKSAKRIRWKQAPHCIAQRLGIVLRCCDHEGKWKEIPAETPTRGATEEGNRVARHRAVWHDGML
jgi:hypothetical protein